MNSCDRNVQLNMYKNWSVIIIWNDTNDVMTEVKILQCNQNWIYIGKKCQTTIDIISREIYSTQSTHAYNLLTINE